MKFLSRLIGAFDGALLVATTLVMAGISRTGVVLSTITWASDADYDIRLVGDCCSPGGVWDPCVEKL